MLFIDKLSKLVMQKLLTPYLTGTDITKFLNEDDRQRVKEYARYWNYYNGYHFEEVLNDEDSPEITTNWVARFINKYVATEFNSGFLFKFENKDIEEKVLPFLNNVWDDNDGSSLMSKVGQSKDVTGDAYVQVYFEDAEDLIDPFGIYPNGRIRLFAIPSGLVFPKYQDGYDDSFEALEAVDIIYPIETEGVLNSHTKVVRYEYTRERITRYIEGEEDYTVENRYGVIPIVPFRNLPLVGSMFGQSDLKDLIPLNIEYNLKASDVSQILDYNASPTTIVQGCKLHNLEKGANKVWCLPSEKAKAYNLELNGDLSASNTHIDRIENSIFNIGSMPKLAIGGETAPSNLSGLALKIAFMPLTDLINQKRVQTEKSLVYLNKIILKVGLTEGLVTMPDNVSPYDFYNHRIWWGEMLPKDEVTTLDMILSELKAGLTTREDAMTRLHKDRVKYLLSEIEKDVKDNPQFYGIQPISLPTSSRLVNSYDGNVIVKEKEQNSDSNANPQIDLKNTVGRNRNGEDNKLNTGEGNTNPPKEE